MEVAILYFAAIDIIAIVYLFMMDIVEAEEKNESSSFKECIKLLGNTTIFLLFVGILVHVGIDVGVNITAPKLLQEKVGMSLAEAGYATSLYFLFRTFGCLSGTFIMAKFSPLKFFVVSVAMIFIGISCLYISMDSMSIYICVALIGVGNSNIFSIIFSKALLYMPSRNNEISGLMIMGILVELFSLYLWDSCLIFWRADWGCSCFDSLCHLSTIPND